MIEQIQIYLQSVEPAEKRIKNKIKKEALAFLGFEMTFELIYKVIYVLIVIVSGII